MATKLYSDDHRAHFTYIWETENSSFFQFYRPLFSPVFTVKSMKMTQWRLWLITAESDVRLFIYREEDSDGPDQVEIDYELSFLGADGLPLIKKVDTYKFRRHHESGFSAFAEKDEIFSRRRAEFLPKDVLTIRCRMWNKGLETPEPDVCFARTRFGLDRHRFVWTFADFSSLPLEHETMWLLKPTSTGSPQLTLIFCLREFEGKEYAYINIDSEDVTKFCGVNGEITLLDAEGVVVHAVKNYKTLSKQRINFCNKFLEKQRLISDKKTLLPNDMLSLRCELEIFYGPLWSGIESCELLASSAQQVTKANVKERNVEQSEESVTGSCPFKLNVFKCLEDGTFSDVILRVDSETFHAHKMVLSSRSPVFEEMFSSDTRETLNRCIEVPDVEPGTLRNLLSYIYTNEMSEVQWDKAADLFRAAHKFKLPELKKKCSATLNTNITITNVCQVLFLADIYQEEVLRKAVIDFISKNLEIFSSEIWNVFKQENPELAMKTMEKIIYYVRI